jgi:hypothetical membrane protein
MLAVLFFVAQLVAAYPWQSRTPPPRGIAPYHPYSFFAQTISDLGATSKFTYGNPPFWSPDHAWMNVALVLLGVVMIIGSPLIYQEFNENSPAQVWVARVAFSAQALAGVGAIAVGLFPENEHPLPHVLGAGLAIAVGTTGVFLLGLALPLPGPIRRFMLWSGPVALTAILLYAIHEYLGFGPGGMERLAAYPEVIWLVAFGFYISRSHYVHGSAHRPPALAADTRSRPGLDVASIPPGRTRLRLPAAPWLPRARSGEPYHMRLTGMGGAGDRHRFSPTTYEGPGLSLTADGVLSGTPRTAGIWRIRVELADEKDTVAKSYILVATPSRGTAGGDATAGATGSV